MLASRSVAIPLFVEYSRRPSLRIERGDDLNFDTAAGACRIVHVRVINAPLADWRARWLLRNDANGCRVTFTFRSLSDNTEREVPGRWSATPEPLFPTDTGMLGFDATKMPQSYVLDLSPGDAGEALGVALKYDGDHQAYAFSAQSYLVPGMRHPAYILRDDEYEVWVEARAGEIVARERFRLENAGGQHSVLKLTPA